MPKDSTNHNRKRSGVLTPEDLDFADRENVIELEEGRFVISPDGPPIPSEGTDAGTANGPGSSVDSPEETEPQVDAESVTEWLTRRLIESGGQYGFSIAAKFDDSVGHRRVVSNDIVTTFEQLLIWYAQQIDDEIPVEDVLGILLTESNVPYSPPVRNISSMLEIYDIDEGEPISALLEAVESSDNHDRDRRRPK